jgi:hypothetical protein
MTYIYDPEGGTRDSDDARGIELGSRVMDADYWENRGTAFDRDAAQISISSNAAAAEAMAQDRACKAERASDAAARLAETQEATRQARAEFRETRPAPGVGPSFLEHAEMDETIARTAFYAALDAQEATGRQAEMEPG